MPLSSRCSLSQSRTRGEMAREGRRAARSRSGPESGPELVARRNHESAASTPLRLVKELASRFTTGMPRILSAAWTGASRVLTRLRMAMSSGRVPAAKSSSTIPSVARAGTWWSRRSMGSVELPGAGWMSLATRSSFLDSRFLAATTTAAGQR